MKKKFSWLRNLTCLLIRNDRWRKNPVNVDHVICEMQFLHKIGFVCLLFVFVVGCSSLKKTTEVNTKASLQSETSVSKDLDTKQSLNLTDQSVSNQSTASAITLDKTEKQSDEWTALLTTFDTSKPVDQITGKHPVLSELAITNKTISDNKLSQATQNTSTAEQNSDIKMLAHSEITLNTDSLSTLKTKDSAQTLTETTLSNKYWILFGILGIVGSLIVYFQLKTGFILSIWNKIKNTFKK